jgi:hypothetical protein
VSVANDDERAIRGLAERDPAAAQPHGCVTNAVGAVREVHRQRRAGATAYDRPVTRAPEGWDVDGPIQAEVFVVWLNGDRLELTGPCGAAPWILELGATDHPVEVVDRIVRDVVGEPRLVHSTSWRRDRDAVILSFVVVIDREQVGAMPSLPIGRTDLARSGVTVAPREIAIEQVVEHGLRHMAWLVQDDPVVRAELSVPWRDALAGYAPEPFRSLG